MQRYGIFSPVLGIKRDFPVELLQDAYAPAAENVNFRDGEIHRAHMRKELLTDTTNNEMILQYERLLIADGTSYTFVFTGGESTNEPKQYRWNAGGPSWTDVTKTGMTTAQTFWSTCTFAGKVIATNGTDKVIACDHDDANFVYLDHATSGVEVSTGPSVWMTTCQWVHTFENYLLALNTTEGGTNYPRRMRWAGIGESTLWLAAEGGGTVEIPGNDRITGCAAMRDSLIIFKDSSVHRLWLTPGDTVWAQEPLTEEYGCIAPHSAVLLPGGELVFVATDKTIRTVRGERISGGIDNILQTMPDTDIPYIQAQRMEEEEETWWTIPTGSGAATSNDKILVLSRDGAWTTRDMQVRAFGKHRNTATHTINGMDSFFSTIDGWDWPAIDYIEGWSGDQDIGSDGTDQTFGMHNSSLTDNGNEYIGKFHLSTTLSQPPNMAFQKRILHMLIHVRHVADGRMSVAVRADGKQTFANVGSISMADTTRGGAGIVPVDLPCDIRGRHFEFRFQSEDVFKFLGVRFDFQPDGVV